MGVAGSGLTQAQIDDIRNNYNAPTKTPTPAPTVATTKPMVGPILPGASRPMVNVPTPTQTSTKPTPAPNNGMLQGPYPQYGANGQITSVNQGFTPPTPNTVQAPNSQLGSAWSDTRQAPQTAAPNLYQDPYARTPEQIAKLAADRIAKILQAGKTSAQGALTGAKNVYDYENQITGDNRTLRNADFKETNNPFSGNTSYQATNMLRNDSIQDTAHDKDYQANVSLINQKLADLEAAAPGDEAAIIDELTQIERQTGISVAQLQEQQKQNQFNQGMQNKQFDQDQQVIDYNQNPNNPQNQGQVLQNQGQAQQNLLNQYKIDDYPAEQKAAAEKIKRETELGNIDLETAKYNFEQLKNPDSTYNQAAKIDLQLKQLDLKNAPQKAKLEIEQLQRNIAEIGKVHYKPQTAAEIAQDKVTLATANKQLADIANGVYPGDSDAPPAKTITAEEYQKNLKPQINDKGQVTNLQQLEDQIILSGMSDWEQYKAYIANNIPWTDPIPQRTTN